MTSTGITPNGVIRALNMPRVTSIPTLKRILFLLMNISKEELRLPNSNSAEPDIDSPSPFSICGMKAGTVPQKPLSFLNEFELMFES